MRGRNEKRRRMAADYMARFDEYKRYIDARREAATGAGAIRYDAVSGNGRTSPVEISVETLEQINMDFRAQIVETISLAWELYMTILEYSKLERFSTKEREIIKAALWMNMTKPLANRYEEFNMETMPVGRATFYNYRRGFLNFLADRIGL